jgi:hypothetical protein
MNVFETATRARRGQRGARDSVWSQVMDLSRRGVPISRAYARRNAYACVCVAAAHASRPPRRPRSGVDPSLSQRIMQDLVKLYDKLNKPEAAGKWRERVEKMSGAEGVGSLPGSDKKTSDNK